MSVKDTTIIETLIGSLWTILLYFLNLIQMSFSFIKISLLFSYVVEVSVVYIFISFLYISSYIVAIIVYYCVLCNKLLI